MSEQIIDFNSLRENVTGKLSHENWMILPSQRTLHIFSLNKKPNGNLSIRNTICIDVDLIVRVFGEENDDTLYRFKLYSWPQLQTLIEQCDTYDESKVDVDESVNSQTNKCKIKDQPRDIKYLQKDTVAEEFCGNSTKTEVIEEATDDYHEPLIEIIESSVSRTGGLGYSHTFVSARSFLPEGQIHSEDVDQNDELLLHKVSETNTNQTQICSICNGTYAVSEMDRHLEKHFNGEAYQCYVCGRQFQTYIGLQKHAASHHLTKDEFFCDICKNTRVFDTKAAIENHMKERHCKPLTGDMKCSICGKQFFSLGKFNTHVRGHDRTGWKKCPICHKSYGSLTRHMNGKHFKIRNHICDICGSAYTQWSALKEHIETKHAQKQHARNMRGSFPCETCGKIFVFKRLLNVHVTLHSGKLYNCDVCGQSFRHPKYLNKHQRQHREMVKLKCTMCDKEYVQKVGLRLHMKKIHGVVIDPAQTNTVIEGNE